MAEPFVYLFGPQAKKLPEEPRETRILKHWARHGGKPDKETLTALRKRLVETEQWRQRVIEEMRRASDALVAGQHTDGLDCPSARTEEYQAGRAQGRYEGYSEANRLLVDIINRAGLEDDLAGG